MFSWLKFWHKKNNENKEKKGFEWLLNKANQLIKRESEVIPIFTYESAIQYFIDERPDNPGIKKGVILRKPSVEGQMIIQVFLDANNTLIENHKGQVCGRQLLVSQLDEELEQAFDNTNMILVE